MNISYNWLKRFIDVEAAPRELAAILTSLGLECDNVEEVESVRGGLRGIVVGKVLTCVPHPDSDHLHVTTVDLGAPEPVQIVCGAPNVAAGQTVVVATIGTVLYDGDKEFTIKKSKMRGVESFGMICAEDEIGLGSSHDGIMVLPDGAAAPGTPAAEYFKLESDWQLEVELTPNRVDAASHYGVARDLKAHIVREDYETHAGRDPQVTLPDVSPFRPDRETGATKVTVEDAAGCLRYSGVTVRGVEVKESPEWLRRLLIAAGQRPINNIVDITNFILLGIGQPLHCFDLGKVDGGEIVVRTCPEGTKFTTLDETERTLDASDLMICDAVKPLCIAGVFGGLDSGVTGATRDVFIESAYFNPTRVRRTARRHGLSTDASFRYERGTDPNITVYAAKLAALLIRELAGGEICGDVSDFYPQPVKDATFDFSFSYATRLIGKEIPRDLVTDILRALEIAVEPTENDDIVRLTVPAYRVDVTRPCDIVEEILRVYGYNNVEFGTEIHANLSQRGATDDSNSLLQLVSERLTAIGFNEILNNSLSSVNYYKDSQEMPLESCISLLNPLSGDLSVMRRTLLFGGLETIAHNANRKATDLRLYEFGKIYSRDPQKQSLAEAPLAPFHEEEELGIWLTGNFTLPSWNSRAAEASFFDLKAIVLNIFAMAGVNMQAIVQKQESDENLAASLVFTDRASGKRVAVAGIVRRSVLKKFDIESDVVFASINWQLFHRLASRKEVTYAPLPKTLPVRRDLALLLDSDVPFAKVEEAIRRSDRKLLREVTLFDVYEGKNLPEGKKSYAVSITLQDTEKTLNDRQIDATMKKIVDNLRSNLGAELR